MYQSTIVKYERRGDTVVPVRVTNQWVSQESRDGKVNSKFTSVRVSELRRFPVNEPDPELPRAVWPVSDRVETRERLMGLYIKGADFLECQLCGGCVIERDHARSACPGKVDEPLVREAGYNQAWLPQGSAPFVGDNYGWSLDNGNGWAREREVAP